MEKNWFKLVSCWKQVALDKGQNLGAFVHVKTLKVKSCVALN